MGDSRFAEPPPTRGNNESLLRKSPAAERTRWRCTFNLRKRLRTEQVGSRIAGKSWPLQGLEGFTSCQRFPEVFSSVNRMAVRELVTSC